MPVRRDRDGRREGLTAAVIASALESVMPRDDDWRRNEGIEGGPR
jgi:hypothetical protein